MIFTHLKSIANIAIVGVVILSTLNADSCKESIVDKQIKSFLKSSNVEELEKLYKSCRNRKTQIAYLIKRGDLGRGNSAKADYREALSLIKENDFEMFEEYRDYLKIKLGIEIKHKDVIDSNELENYITKRGSQTRGAWLGSFSRLKGIPINFNSGSSTIKQGVNLAQAKEIGKLVSKPKYKNRIIYITGYTDTKGSDEYNKNLSKQRAESLKSYLINNFNLKEKNLITEGLGESFPIYNKRGKENYYKSRRVTLEYGE